MRITKPIPPHVPDVAEVNKLNAYMQTRDNITFDQLRRDIAGWINFPDGTVSQHCQDAGFDIHTR